MFLLSYYFDLRKDCSAESLWEEMERVGVEPM